MRKVMTTFLLVLVGVGAWWGWANKQEFHDLVGRYVENGEIMTLEAQYTAEEIMDAHRKDLLADNQKTFQEPTLRFYPYILMDVKYTADKKSKEGVILWGLVDGEMVINTETWEKTHGFEDAILAQASPEDFKILNALAKNNGSLSIDQLTREMKIEASILHPWIESAREKHLITQSGNTLQLHFQNPKILVPPQTKITQHLVTKPYSHAQKVSSKYSFSQIEKSAKAAFGNDFKVRSYTEVFLPVYSLEVLNPDGSIMTSYWNSLTGQRINPKYLTAQ